MSKFQPVVILRWTVPVIATLLFIALGMHKSLDPILFSRYNYNFFTLVLSSGLLATVCWWISLGEMRYRRLFNRISRLPVVSLSIVFVGLFALADIFIDLIAVIAVLPAILSVMLLLPAAPVNADKIGSASHMPNLHNALRSLALVMVSIFIGLIFVEIVFRTFILEPKVPTTEPQFSKQISSAWPHEISVDKPAGTFRILGLSDSFGRIGNDQNYHYQLEELLLEAGYNVEVVNLSVVDYGPYDELEVLKRFGVRYEPDLILHGFYIGNDFGVPNTHIMTYLGIGTRRPQGYVAFRPRNFLSVQWTRSFITVQIDKARRMQEAGAASPNPRGILSKTGFLNVERRFLKNFEVAPPPKQRWAATVNNLDEIRTEAQQMGVHYLMVVHPDQVQINSELRSTLEQTFGVNLAQGYNFKLPQQFLSDYCASREINCLDLLPAFLAHDATDTYRPNDIHYSEAGNSLAADEIFQFLHGTELLKE